MNIKKYLKQLFATYCSRSQLNNSFIFPYSTVKEIKRKQIWNNLEKGILFEDTQVLIPWLTPYSELDKYSEKRKDSGDRINWFLGQHQILDGINSYVGVVKWIYINDNSPFSQTDEFLGFDDEGNKRFIQLKEKFTDLLGEPNHIQLEKFGGNDVGGIAWTNQKISIYLSGIEQVSCKYRLCVGLKENEVK